MHCSERSIPWRTPLIAMSLFMVVTSAYPSKDPEGIITDLSKKSFQDLQCKGMFHKATFARLDQVCEDCFTVYMNPDIHSKCRERCFNNKIFRGCLDALLLSHEKEVYDNMVDYVGGW
ncbi:unnamed protein product [Darwinula stevensoni]|uniref:Uncharacterized protein n=1 Tax=Darwinula stevensoni TaxID=69355 RepID=A0A7R8XJF7_9CRUS|nr:unnamed protein product [Darwinula stevensoni]CAG0895286.1 unnamed protein product [Darwinula stevensoni]